MSAKRVLGVLALASISACGGSPSALVDGAVGAKDALLDQVGADRSTPGTDGPGADLASPGGDAGEAGQAGDAGQAGQAGSDAGGGGEVGPLSPAYCDRGSDVPGVTPPTGFCVKKYAAVVEPRALVVAPNGDLFVAAPSEATPGGAAGGPAAIILLSDDDHDGVAEPHVFLARLDSARKLTDVHGLALGGGFLYFTTQASVWRTPYAPGQRVAAGEPQDLGLPASFATGGRWTHGLALSKGGQLLASRGAYATCGTQPAGDISAVGAGGALTTVASGFRNPMYMRCHATDEVCAAMELGEDLAAGAHEKMVVLHPGTSYGYPCCYTKSAPVAAASMTCDTVTLEDATFPLSDTPFGFDWEPGRWPAPFSGAIFVALHGSAYSSPAWQGAAIVYAATNPTTHVPTQDWQPFLQGFGVGGTVLERPADIAFSPDGRMFFADDQGGAVYWMAPRTLLAPDAPP